MGNRNIEKGNLSSLMVSRICSIVLILNDHKHYEHINITTFKIKLLHNFLKKLHYSHIPYPFRNY